MNVCNDCRAEKQARLRTANPDKYRVEARTRYERNPLPYIMAAHNYRARLFSAVGSYTEQDAQRLLSEQQNRCYYCELDLTSVRKHLDHKIALAIGGSNSADNLCWACGPCNESKHDKTVAEFIAYRLRRGLHVRSALRQRRAMED